LLKCTIMAFLACFECSLLPCIYLDAQYPRQQRPRPRRELIFITRVAYIPFSGFLKNWLGMKPCRLWKGSHRGSSRLCRCYQNRDARWDVISTQPRTGSNLPSSTTFSIFAFQTHRISIPCILTVPPCMAPPFPSIQSFFHAPPSENTTSSVDALSTEPGDGFTTDEVDAVLHPQINTSWTPAQDYEECDIASLVPGPHCVTFLGRIANFFDQATPSKKPKAAKGCMKLVVKDDTAALTVSSLSFPSHDQRGQADI
jgi:hypothetical protein